MTERFVLIVRSVYALAPGWTFDAAHSLARRISGLGHDLAVEIQSVTKVNELFAAIEARRLAEAERDSAREALTRMRADLEQAQRERDEWRESRNNSAAAASDFEDRLIASDKTVRRLVVVIGSLEHLRRISPTTWSNEVIEALATVSDITAKFSVQPEVSAGEAAPGPVPEAKTQASGGAGD